jgi:two-component system response regulator YesN
MGMAYMNYRTLTIVQNLRTCKMEGAFLHLELHKFILELLSEYFRDLKEHDEDETGPPTYYKNLLEKIKNHILIAPNTREHTIANLTRLFAISGSALTRAFKKSNDMSLSEFVHQQVMAKSHYLLTTTDKTIEEIAEELGYAWRPAFEHAFKNFYHQSPRSLRANISKN